MINKNEDDFQCLYNYLKSESIQSILFSKNKDHVLAFFPQFSENDLRLCLYLVTIDRKDIKGMVTLNNYYYHLNKKKGEKEYTNPIYTQLYQHHYLNPTRLKTLVAMSAVENIQFKITTDLFKGMIEANDLETLKLLLERLVYDNKFILCMLHCYQLKKPLSHHQWKSMLREEMTRVGLNAKDKEGQYPLLLVCKEKYESIFNLLVKQTITHGVLELNAKNNYGQYPLLELGFKGTYGMMKTLLDYANQHHLVLKVNEKDQEGYYPLLIFCFKGAMDKVRLLMEYANQHHLLLEINQKNQFGNYPLLMACMFYHGDFSLIKLLMDYAGQHHVSLALCENNQAGNQPLDIAILDYTLHDRLDLMRLLMRYAKKNRIRVNGKYRMEYFIMTKHAKINALVKKFYSHSHGHLK